MVFLMGYIGFYCITRGCRGVFDASDWAGRGQAGLAVTDLLGWAGLDRWCSGVEDVVILFVGR